MEQLEPKDNNRDLENAWREQVNELIEYGFNTELGLSPEEYVYGLPKFETQSQSFRNRFDLPLLVDPRVSLTRQIELQGVDLKFLQRRITLDAKELLERFEHNIEHETPYQIWVQNGSKSSHKSISEWQETTAKDEAGLTILEGLALARKPQRAVCKLPGSRLRTENEGTIYTYITYRIAEGSNRLVSLMGIILSFDGVSFNGGCASKGLLLPDFLSRKF